MSPCNTGCHDACRSCTGTRGRDFLLGIRRANPPGHTSTPGAAQHGSWLVLPAGQPARL